jgi:hypothetical protein
VTSDNGHKLLERLELKITAFWDMTPHNLVDVYRLHGMTSRRQSNLHSHCHENLKSYEDGVVQETEAGLNKNA